MKEATITKGKTVQKDIAFEYAKRNVPVFPCVAEGMEEYRYVKGKGYVLKNIKEPLTPNGFKNATTDRGQIEEWWNMWPDALVAIPTGEKIGRMVVDVDSLEEYEKLGHPPLPDTYTITTPGGGFHYYLEHEKGIKNSEGSFKTKTDDGENIFDIRGEGGYVIAPHNPGYEVINNPGNPAKMPEWLLKGLRSPRKAQRGRGRGSTPDTVSRTSHGKITASEVYSEGVVKEGSRNDTLFGIALDLEGTAEERGDILLHINHQFCSPPLDEHEVIQLASSSMKYSRRKVDEECLDCAQYLFEVAMFPERAESFGISLPAKELTVGKRDVLFAAAHFLSLHGRTDINGYPSVVKDVRSIAEEAAVEKGEVSNALQTFREMGLVRTEVAEDVPGHPYRWTFPFYSKPHPGTYDDNVPLSVLDFIEEGERIGEGAATFVNNRQKLKRNTTNTPSDYCSQEWRFEDDPLVKAYDKVQSFRDKGLIRKVKGLALRFVAYRDDWVRIDDLTKLFGHSRPRYTRSKVLDPLVEMNLLEEKGGLYRLHEEYEKNLQMVLNTRCSEEGVKIRRYRDGKRKVAVPAVSTKLDISEYERKSLQHEQHRNEREQYRSLMRELKQTVHESYEKMKREVLPPAMPHNDFERFMKEREICENPKELDRLYREKMKVKEGSG